MRWASLNLKYFWTGDNRVVFTNPGPWCTFWAISRFHLVVYPCETRCHRHYPINRQNFRSNKINDVIHILLLDRRVWRLGGNCERWPTLEHCRTVRVIIPVLTGVVVVYSSSAAVESRAAPWRVPVPCNWVEPETLEARQMSPGSTGYHSGCCPARGERTSLSLSVLPLSTSLSLSLSRQHVP